MVSLIYIYISFQFQPTRPPRLPHQGGAKGEIGIGHPGGQGGLWICMIIINKELLYQINNLCI
jgi:hypothetical protein